MDYIILTALKISLEPYQSKIMILVRTKNGYVPMGMFAIRKKSYTDNIKEHLTDFELTGFLWSIFISISIQIMI